MRTLIQDGLIYDGTGKEPFRGSILTDGGTIARVGRFNSAAADKIIDAKGMAVTPGFVDTHRHADFAVLRDPDFGTPELAQGITSILNGNCGLGVVPVTAETSWAVYDFIEPCIGKAPKGTLPQNYPSYLERLTGAPLPLNAGLLASTGAVKAAVKGFEKSPFTRQEMSRAKAYLAQALECGAPGISCGIMYTPECYSTHDEFVELLSAASPYGRTLTCHIRGEGDGLVDAVEEILSIAKEAELPLNISHFKSVGCKNWGYLVYHAIEKVEQARARGQEVTVDFYPYTGGSTTLLTLLPPSFVEAEAEKTLSKLSAREGVDLLRRELKKEHPGWDNMVESIGWERIVISSVTKEENRVYQGRNVQEITRECGFADETAFVAELLCAERGKVGIIVMSMAQDDVDTIAKLPYAAVISDSLYGGGDCPHPRLYGSFPKILRDFVRERGILTMEQAVHKMTGMPAKRFGLAGRGLIEQGFHADLNVFDPALITDRAEFSAPKRLAEGMALVMVDGRTAYDSTGRTAGAFGQILRVNGE